MLLHSGVSPISVSVEDEATGAAERVAISVSVEDEATGAAERVATSVSVEDEATGAAGRVAGNESSLLRGSRKCKEGESSSSAVVIGGAGGGCVDDEKAIDGSAVPTESCTASSKVSSLSGGSVEADELRERQ